MIDEDFRIWMIEINSNPYIGAPSAYMGRVIPKMIDDMFQIVLDPCFKPKNKTEHQKTTNDFELIYSEEKEGVMINHRRPYSFDLVYPIKHLR